MYTWLSRHPVIFKLFELHLSACAFENLNKVTAFESAFPESLMIFVKALKSTGIYSNRCRNKKCIA